MLSTCCKKISYKRQDGEDICVECGQVCGIANEQHNTGVAIGMANKDIKDGGKDVRIRAEKWMNINLNAMALFEAYALERYNQRRKFGVKALVERVRWDSPVSTTGSQFKISNGYAPYIARRLIAKHPYLEDYIELRKTKY